MPTAAIVADDFGMSTFRTDGIMQCFYNGSISQASLMVTGDDATRAVRLAKNAQHPHQLPLGLHFNITQGNCACEVPLVCEQFLQNSSCDDNSSSSSKLVSKFAQNFVNHKTRKFHDKIPTFFHVGNVALNYDTTTTYPNDTEENEGETQEIEIWFNIILEELCAQLALFEQLCGHFPFALDGHHHIHVLPIVSRVISAFFKSPFLESFSPLQRRIIDRYLPGTSAAAAVRALRYLRVPLPPLCDLSRVEDWRGSPADDLRLPKKVRRNLWDMKVEEIANYSRIVEGTGRTDNDEDNKTVVVISSTTTNGAPFFARITWCAYHAFKLWEEDGLFGPVEKRMQNGQQQQQQQQQKSTSVTRSLSQTPRRLHQDDPVAATTNIFQEEDEQKGADGGKSPSSNTNQHFVVDTVSPFRRRGVVVTTTTEATHTSTSSSTKTSTTTSIVGLSHAIIPRRLCCFASGPAVNVEYIQTALNNLQKEEEELKIRREMMEILIELEQLQKDPSSFSSASNLSLQEYFDKKMHSLKQNHFRLNRLVSSPDRLENYQLYQNEKFVGNEFTNQDCYSLNVMPWATDCSEELEVMVHPSVAVPKLFDDDDNNDDDQENEKNKNDETAENRLRRSQAAQIKSAWYGPTKEFYCKWSRSDDRLVELDFLTSEKFSASLSGANCAVACYDEYCSSNLIRGGGGRSTGRS